MRCRSILIILVLMFGLLSVNPLYASDKYKIDKSIFGFYLGEHYSSLNKRLEKRGLEKVGRTGSHTTNGPLNNSKIVKEVIIKLNEQGYVRNIVIHFKDNSDDHFIALKTAICNSWNVAPLSQEQLRSLAVERNEYYLPNSTIQYYRFSTLFGWIHLKRNLLPMKNIDFSAGIIYEISLDYDYEKMDIIQLDKEEL